MPMILVKKNPRGKVIRVLSSEEETAVKTVCGLKKPATMALHITWPIIFSGKCVSMMHGCSETVFREILRP